MRSRQRGQSIVEFGILALIFTLLMFAIVDLGLLLNSWVRLSAATREAARAATVGFQAKDLKDTVLALVLPGVSHTPYPPFAQYCCGDNGSNDEIVLHVDYYDGSCIPGVAGCTPLSAATIDKLYWGGACNSGCAHPARGDMIVLSLAAPGMEVLTPLVRPFFNCDTSAVHCNVRLGSTAVMRYEGHL